MRTFSCFYDILIEGNREPVIGSACWGTMNNFLFKDNGQARIKKIAEKKGITINTNQYIPGTNLIYYPTFLQLIDEPVIWIKRWKDPETEKYAHLLVSIINKITPCSIEEDESIKFHLLKTYDQSLILLNFIRNLWHSSSEWNKSYATYSKEFFQNLEKLVKSKDISDPLEILLTANKEACTAINANNMPGHSNINPPSKLVIRTKKELLAYKGDSTYSFLRGGGVT